MTDKQIDKLCLAVSEAFSSPNVLDSNFEQANIVDAIANVANGLFKIAKVLEARRNSSNPKEEL